MAATLAPAMPFDTVDGPRRNAGLSASDVAGEEPSATEKKDSIVALVKACRDGDRAAFRQVYDACHEKVYRLAARMVGLQDAADITQEVFLQALRSIKQFRGDSKFETWLYRLAVNASLQYLRCARRQRHHELKREPMDDMHRENEDARKEVVEWTLSRIDPVLRSIFLLREVEGLSYHEIAKALDIPEGTVGSRLNRARRDLRRQLLEQRSRSSGMTTRIPIGLVISQCPRLSVTALDAHLQTWVTRSRPRSGARIGISR